MSQKTNPLSLRLQKGGNRHFSSPWFTDVFFSDTLQHESSIKRYIDRLLKETQYSKAFFSTKSFYRKFNILFSIQDTRAQKKEKQLLFNLKSNLSGNLHSMHGVQNSASHTLHFAQSASRAQQSLASKSVKNFIAMHGVQGDARREKCKLDSLHSRSTYQSGEVNLPHVVNEVNLPYVVDNLTLSSLTKTNYNDKTISLTDTKKHISKNDALSCKDDRYFFQDNASHSLILEGSQMRSFSNFFRNKVRNNFIKFKQNYNLRSFAKKPAQKSETIFGESTTFLASNKNGAPSSLIVEGSKMQLERIVDYSYGTMLTVPSTHFARDAYTFSVLLRTPCFAFSMHTKCKDDKSSFIEVLSQSFAQAQQKYFQNIIKNRNCLTYCEKIVSQHFVTENIKQKQKLDFSSVFLSNAFFEDIKFFSDPKNWHLRYDPFRIKEENYTSLLYNFKMQSIASEILSESSESKERMHHIYLTGGEKNNRLVYSTTASALKLKKPITHFEPIRFVNATQSVAALLDQIVTLLERRVSFREIKSKLFKNVERDCLIKGVRFSCSGRLGGRSKKAQKAKIQSYQWGATSLNAFSSKIVFANKSATTSYGKIGVKIWLSFKDEEN